MNLTITGHHVEVTPALQSYVEEKVERVLRHFDHATSAQVILRVERNTHKAEVTVHVKGKDFFAEATDPADLYAAIDFMVDKLDRQVRKHKEIVTDHHQPVTPAAQGE